MDQNKWSKPIDLNIISQREILMSVFRTKQLVERELALEEQPQDRNTYEDGADDEEDAADEAANDEEGADLGLTRAPDQREELVDFSRSLEEC